ncbi:nucleotide-diphospho-sugar transferase [Polyplosphaeria fusca]|uniref:Nucleotide-diphospho-sugar transferase n=1 Tax=Polyplosphaeria fusca TaxID=682080 RepID=A0A9P4QZ87_9PLEO|nr:nucleotide-diphospho-sugar transferase [Polyplosphaeria fusca]
MLIRPTHLTRVGALLVLLFVAGLYFFNTHGWSRPTFDHFNYKIGSASYTAELVPFWKDLAASLEAARPQCPPINVTKGEMSNHDKNWEPLVEKTRPQRITLSEDDEAELEKKHRLMRLAAKRLGPALPIGHGTGIVTTGGLKLFPILLVSLRMLRRTGCTLPVQVFLGDKKEYDEVAQVCETILPTMNARCEVISDVYSQAEGVPPPEHFQFKVLAILFSAFEHVLFLDADAFPAHDPTPLMTSPPYTTHGLVTWPGFYANAASAHFYHIASIPEAPVNRGTESGILLLNKEHHRESLLMMVYYNYYGPKYYYPLQAQGGPGQGDKETFPAGALAANAPGPFYQVRTPPYVIGKHVDGNYRFAGAAQADPLQDYQYSPPPPTHLHKEYSWNNDDKIGAQDAEKAKPRAFFVHTVSQGTKLDPAKLLREGGLAFEADRGDWHRIWGDEEWAVEKFGFDVEKRMWECVQEEACRTDEKLCSDVKSFREKVFGK